MTSPVLVFSPLFLPPCPRTQGLSWRVGWGGSRWAAAAGSGGPGELRGGEFWASSQQPAGTHVHALPVGPVLQLLRHRLQSSRMWLDRCVWLGFKAGKGRLMEAGGPWAQLRGKGRREGILPWLSGIGGPAGPRGQPGAHGWDVPLGSSPGMLRRTRPSRCPRLGWRVRQAGRSLRRPRWAPEGQGWVGRCSG